MGRVLLIEDEKEFRISIKNILQYENFEVFTVQNGIEGLEMVRQINPDIILCDIMMPDMDGYEVLKNLNEHKIYPPIPFVFITALNSRDNFRMGMNLGADDYLTKPFTRKELLDTISSRIKKHSTLKTYVQKKIEKIEKEIQDKLSILQKELKEKEDCLSCFTKKNKKLNKQLKEKEIELIKETFSTIETNNTLKDLNDTISKELKRQSLPDDTKNILISLKKKINKKTVLWNNWTIFQLKFNRVYPKFISNLTIRYPNLTQYEMVFISAHLMGLSTNQIADLLNISDSSVRKSRYRIKKKLRLKKEDNFLTFIHSLNR